jgi:ZIP family zinc transporter
MPDDPSSLHPILLGLGASAAAGAGTLVGALGLAGLPRPTQRTYSILLGAAAGIMLAATVFSLLLPALGAATERVGHDGGGFALVAVGFVAGALAVGLLDRYAPHEHFVQGLEGQSPERVARIWLFVIAIAIHNVPEGLAVGVGYAGGGAETGVGLALGIGLQNVPEGLAVAASLLGVGYGRWTSIGWAAATGVVEPVAGVLGAAAVWLFEPLLPFALAFAGGAMLFVVSDEVIPETHREGHESAATYALVAGFVAMTGLDRLIG